MLHPMPLARTAACLRRGDIGLLAFTEMVLNRLDDMDPQLQAFLPEPGRHERVMRAAQATLERWPEPDVRPPLFGVPLGVKDIYRVDGLPTSVGSALPAALFESAQADCVTRLQRAGALVLGKTVTTEFACFEPGPTRNPHNPAHTPGGSSSGSAAAVAAGECALALGSQTIGSVIRPAAFCAVVGFKPGYGRIDAEGVVYVARSLDHVGLFTQDVAGMRLAASLLCHNWREVCTARKPTLAALAGPMLELLDDEGRAGYEGQLEALQRAGYAIQRVTLFEDHVSMEDLHRSLMACEMSREHQLWFEAHEATYRSGTAELIRRGLKVDPVTVERARASQARTRQELHNRMDAAGIDLWLSPPATGPAPAGIGHTGDPVMNLPWTHAGLPSLSIPAGRASNGLPLGLQISSRHGADEFLLHQASGLEEALSGLNTR
ncbi:MAG: amidase [Anaerolineaceae bacterium]|nr:amidase [Anaerolineaceae bacterium]MDE0329478.1 amidase [Anaerolineaceae bacterium]